MAELERRLPKVVASGLALDLLAFHTTPLGTAEEHAREELRQTYAHRQEVLEPLVQECGNLYLLVNPAKNEPSKPPASRLAHDTLAPLVRRRFEESDAPGQRARRILENRAVDWQNGEQGPALDDADLAVAEIGEPGMRSRTDAERSLVEASRTAKASRGRRNRMSMFAGIAAVLFIFIASAFAVWQTQASQDAQERERQAQEREQEANLARATEQALRAEADAAKGIAVTNEQAARKAEGEAVAAKAEVERLTRGIRADQLTANGLKVLDENPLLALLLAVEGLRVQNDITQTVPITRIRYDFGQATYGAETRVIITGETVVASAQTNMHALLGKVGGIPLPGHADWVRAIAFSPDGHWLATASRDTTARLWDVTTADPSVVPIILAGHEDEVVSVAFSPDGCWLATASLDNSARLWDVTAADPSADPIVLARHGSAVESVAFSPDGRWLATASWDNTARLWDVTAADPSADPIILAGHEDDVRSVAFSPDGRWLATASWDNTARLWDVAAADPSADPIVLAGHEDAVRSVAFSPDGRWLATASGIHMQIRMARPWTTPPGCGT